jgi:hypothetical protein
LGSIPGLLEFDDFLPKQLGAVLELREHQQEARDWHDVFFVLEATIGFNKREDVDDDELELEAETELDVEPEVEVQPPARRKFGSAKIKWTSQDAKFLRALKISVDDETR